MNIQTLMNRYKMIYLSIFSRKKIDIMSVPVCEIPFTEEEMESYVYRWEGNVLTTEEENLKQTLEEYIGADCWAVVSCRTGRVTLHFENWTWWEEHHDCHGNDNARFFYETERIDEWDIGDYIDVYMFGSNTWRARFTKTSDELWSREYFKSEMGLIP